ncbi:MAG: FkbM family methyltransferase [Deferribacterales bacterium]
MRFGKYKIYKINELDKSFFNRDRIFDLLLKDIDKPVIFDVGANIGQSVAGFKQKVPDAVIHSFEPDSDCFDILKSKCADYRDVTAVNAGLGASEDIITLYKYEESTANSFNRISSDSMAVRSQSHKKVNRCLTQPANTQECRVLTIDGYCRENGIGHINLLKIDVQGFENEVLKGAAEMIGAGRVDIILTELSFDDLYGKGNSFYALESHIIPFGYALYDISHIYKNIRLGKTCWVDALYVRKAYEESVLNRVISGEQNA